MDNLVQKFKNPAAEFRSAPFWSWNGDLEPEELKKQVNDMKQHGMGGFFMHSREGLETEYMGRKWLQCIRETVEEASKTNMKAWLYDEDRWPSGFAGGLIAEKLGDEARAKLLVLDIIESGIFKPEDEAEAVFTVKLNEKEELLEIQQISEEDVYELGENEKGLIFKREITEPSPWFNGDSYGDNLNPESVKEFINITYEAYREEVGDKFGDTIPGIFTDEPNIYSHHQPNMQGVPWTDILPEYFEDKRGYDLLTYLPYLFFDGKKSKKIRHDFWWTISELFTEAYTQQLGKWCEKHGLALTGHFLLENEFADAIRTTGSIMPHYQYMEVPGIDILTESTRENLTVKQCSSAAHQFGRDKVLSELYGCTGWEFTFEGQKWVGDWQFALGVNYRCQHLTLYSLRGCRKRDYPPSFNYNNTWWKYNKVVEDYFGRLSALLTGGEEVRDILVLHPIATAWANFDGSNMEEINEMGYEFQEFVEVLLGQHRDFDLGDETILAEYGEIVDTKFKVNKAAYELVIIPPLSTLRQTTVDLLKEFVENGGKIIACKPLPHLIEGEENEEIQELLTSKNIDIIENKKQMEDLLKSQLPREISIKDSSGSEDDSFLYLQKSYPERELYYIVNNDRDSTHEVEIELYTRGKVERWDPLTGEIEEVFAQEKEEMMILEDEIGAAGSRVYVVNKNEKPVQNQPAAEVEKYSKYIGAKCDFERTYPNVLTLDYCKYKMEDDKWSEEMQVWQAQKEIREALDMRPIYTNGIEQRWRWINEPHENDGKPVSFSFNFEVETVPESPLYLVLEGSENFKISFNDKKVTNDTEGWFLDKSFDKIKLGIPEKGENKIILSCKYENKMEVEDCYIIGDFGVEAETRKITEEPKQLHFGDWCLQGYFHYAGSMIYKDKLDFDLRKNERVYLYLKNHSAITTEVRINGQSAAHIPWSSADGVDITDYIHRGQNKFEIEVMGSPRNMMGPLHQKSGRLPWTGSDSFRTTGNNYTSDYVIQPYGLMDEVELKVVERKE